MMDPERAGAQQQTERQAGDGRRERARPRQAEETYERRLRAERGGENEPHLRPGQGEVPRCQDDGEQARQESHLQPAGIQGTAARSCPRRGWLMRRHARVRPRARREVPAESTEAPEAPADQMSGSILYTSPVAVGTSSPFSRM